MTMLHYLAKAIPCLSSGHSLMMNMIQSLTWGHVTLWNSAGVILQLYPLAVMTSWESWARWESWTRKIKTPRPQCHQTHHSNLHLWLTTWIQSRPAGIGRQHCHWFCRIGIEHAASRYRERSGIHLMNQTMMPSALQVLLHHSHLEAQCSLLLTPMMRVTVMAMGMAGMTAFLFQVQGYLRICVHMHALLVLWLADVRVATELWDADVTTSPGPDDCLFQLSNVCQCVWPMDNFSVLQSTTTYYSLHPSIGGGVRNLVGQIKIPMMPTSGQLADWMTTWSKDRVIPGLSSRTSLVHLFHFSKSSLFILRGKRNTVKTSSRISLISSRSCYLPSLC